MLKSILKSAWTVFWNRHFKIMKLSLLMMALMTGPDGIDISRGKYLYFPDSDDWIENDYLCDLYKTARKTRSKLVISGFVMEYAEGNVKQHFCVIPDRCDYSSLQEVRLNLHKYFDNMMMAVPWNKLYEAEYVRNNNIRFPNTNWDDMFFNLEVIRDIDHVAISSSNGYHYFRSRNQSETRKVFDTQLYSKRREQYLYILDVYQYWGINDTKIDAVLQGYYAEIFYKEESNQGNTE